ncbi:MAG: leucine-rich repeat protein [Ruminococcus sp.]|nr:leucine-rich repeat protein [Ruminococcus sp.]
MKISKKFLSVALSAAMVISPAAQAGFAAFGGTAFTVSAAETETMVYDIYADHAVLAKYTAAGDKVTIPAEYQGLPVTAIGEYAFLGNSSIVSVTIPDSVTSIGESAFAMCKNLENISIPTSVNEIGGYAFSNTKWLYAQRVKNPLVIVNNIVADGGACGKSANIPEGTVAISDYAFADCYELADVTIPASVKVIGATSFSGTPWEAKSLTSAGALVINDMLVKGCNMADGREDLIIEQDKVPNYAYAEREGYKNIQLGGQIKTIGNSAFSALKGLETFELFSPVTDIQSHAFEDCRSLKSFMFKKDDVRTIGSYVFRNCTSLSEISLPGTVESLGKGAFENCSAMKKITIPNEKCFIFDSPETISKEAVIYGYSGSTAEAYANKYSRTFVALEPAQGTTTAPAATTTAAATTAAPTSPTAVTTAAAPVTTETSGNKVVITLPNVPEGSRIIVIVTKGDTDGNSRIDSSDASAILQEYARLSTGGESGLDSDGKAVSDVDGDGAVSAKDASIVLEYYSYISTGGDETICEHTNIESKIRGDVTGDGFVELTDLATLRQFIAKSADVEINMDNADMNDDGVVDITDLSMLSLKLVDSNVKGDANGDGEVNKTDKEVFENYVFVSKQNKIIEKQADIDGNGKVDYIDYNLLCELLCDDEIKGDVNSDGSIDIADLATFRQLISHQEVEINEKNADINGDGKADMTDMSKLSMMLVGD